VTVSSTMDFWFDFDNAFNPAFGQVTDAILDAYDVTEAPFGITSSWRRHRSDGTYPDGFREEMEPKRDSLLLLADEQLAILDRHFHGDAEAERSAFEEFGQGVHFDDRRPAGDKVHKMDTGGPTDPPTGYHNWHAFTRAAVLVGADADRWLTMDRNVGLAWAIQSVARPADDAPDNPPLDEARLQSLRTAWLPLDADGLDEAFDSFPFPPNLEAPAASAGAP
jgi:hypothetical protein